MRNKQRIGLNLLILFLFLWVTLFIHFFHQESDFQGSTSCPACHFQNSTLTTAPGNVFTLPQLTQFDTLRSFEAGTVVQIVPAAPSSQSPPAV